MSAGEAVPQPGHCMPVPGSMPRAEPELHAEFMTTLERRRPQLERLAMSMMRSQEDAEDIVQESVLKALRFLPRFRGDARLDTWLHTIVANTARDWLRMRRQHPALSLEAEPDEWGAARPLDVPHPGENAEESCARRQLLRLLREEICRLDPVYQMPIRLCDLDGRSYREAARMLNLSGPAIKARLFRGRLLLKNRLARHSDLRGSATHRGRGRKRRSGYRGIFLPREDAGGRCDPQ